VTEARDDRQSKYATLECRLDYLTGKYERGITMNQITKIRKEVATLANRINKKINDLSAAFRRSWQIVKGRQLVSRVNGVTYGTRQRALRKLEQYSADAIGVTLEREAGNAYDVNAIRVMVNVGSGAQYHLGFLPRDLADLLAPVMDKGVQLAARFKSVIGGYEGRENRGALIAIEM